MKIAIIDKKDVNITTENSTIKFDDIKLPFKLVDTLLISNNAKINTKDLIKINQNNINIVLLNSFSHQSSIITSANPKNGQLKLLQYQALDKKLPIAKYFITEKLKRHAHQLKCNEIYIETESYLQKIQEANHIETLLGVEGSFAREYFEHYFTLLPKKYHKSKRSKRPPLDPVNALLSYFYYLTHNIITVKLLSYGFETGISYLHTPFRDHDALSSDLLELFRDQINQFVVLLFQEEIVSINHFQKRGGVYLNYEGKKVLHPHLKDLLDGINHKVDMEISILRGML
jgi:CRISPR-associated protein Cas1